MEDNQLEAELFRLQTELQLTQDTLEEIQRAIPTPERLREIAWLLKMHAYGGVTIGAVDELLSLANKLEKAPALPPAKPEREPAASSAGTASSAGMAYLLDIILECQVLHLRARPGFPWQMLWETVRGYACGAMCLRGIFLGRQRMKSFTLGVLIVLTGVMICPYVVLGILYLYDLVAGVHEEPGTANKLRPFPLMAPPEALRCSDVKQVL